MNVKEIEIGHHYRVTGDRDGQIVKVFNIVEDRLLIGGVLFDPETNTMRYTQGFAPADPEWTDHAHVHIPSDAPEVYREQIGDEVGYDQLHALAIRARSAVSHFVSMDTGPLRAWQKKIFGGADNP